MSMPPLREDGLPAISGSAIEALTALEPERPTGLRGVAYALVTWPPFDLFILFVIISSCAVMASRSPLKEKNGEYTAAEEEFYERLDDVFLWIFTAEVCLKQLALGPGGYFAEAWNTFDFFVVGSAWIRVVFPESGNLTVLRAVRVLRALRMVNRVPSLKKIVRTLIGAFPELANVVTLFCMFIFLFGILGVNLFEGKLHFRCTEPGAATPIADTALCNTAADCEGAQTCKYYELGPNFGAISYDDVISAWATIFQAVTLEGWVDQMYELEKTTSKAASIFFYLLVVLIGAFFLVNLFLAVLFDAFAKQQEAEDQLSQLNSRAEAQAKAVEAEQRRIASSADPQAGEEAAVGSPAAAASPASPPDKLALLGDEVDTVSSPFRKRGGGAKGKISAHGERLVYGLIVLNTLTMCAAYADQSEEWAAALYFGNVFFTSAFFLEMTVKLCVLGRHYFEFGWNRFDFLVTWCSAIDLVLDYYGHDTELLRALRVCRVMRLLRLNRKMRRFEETVDKVASLVINLSGILILFMVMFAMLGMELFGAKMGSPPPRTHFDDFSSAFVTVFCISSGEDWNAVFASALEFGASWSVAALYFIPLFLMDNYILVNLFVAIICWGWEQADNSEQAVGFTLTCHGDADSDFTLQVEEDLKAAIGKLVSYSADKVRLKTEPLMATHFHITVQVTPSSPMDIDRLLHALGKDVVADEVRRQIKALQCESASDASVQTAEEEDDEMNVEKVRMVRAHEMIGFNVSRSSPPPEGSLKAEHGLLTEALQKMAKERKLEMSEVETGSILAALHAPINEFMAVAQTVLPEPDAQLRAPLSTAEAVAGLTVGFSTLILGTRQLLTQLAKEEGAFGNGAASGGAAGGGELPPPGTPSEATALLLAYWDAPHARMKRQPDESIRLVVPKPAAPPTKPSDAKKGGGGGAAPSASNRGGGAAAGGGRGGAKKSTRASKDEAEAASGVQLTLAAADPTPLALRISGSRLIDQLELLMKQYVTAVALSSNPTLSEAIERLRVSARAARKGKGFTPGKPGATPSSSSSPSLGGSLARFGGDCWGACCGAPSSAPEDPLGAAYLPLGDTGSAARLRLVREVVMAPAFEGFIQLCILCSSAALAFDMPDVVPGSQLDLSLNMADKVFTSIFVVEMSLKLMAFGAFAPPDGYFRSAWNKLDAAIVTSSVLSLLLTDVEGLGALRAMRALRALRPLRAVQRFSGLKKVVNSLLRAVPQVGDVAQVCVLVLIVYGLFGMQLLIGRMAECNDSAIFEREQCVGSYVDEGTGELVERWWGNDDIGNFDHIGAAMLTLFEMATLEMWPDVMFRAMDTDPHAEGRGLVRNANASTMAPFMISWIVVSAFLLINLFVGVVLENFNAIRKKEDGSGFMDEGQKQWAKTVQAIFSAKATRKLQAPSGKGCFARLRHRCFRLVSGDPASAIAFEKGVALLVLVNVLTMAVKWYDQPKWVDIFAEVVDWFFTLAFTVEMALKLLALGPGQYVADGWNLLDGTLVTSSIVDHALTYLTAAGLPVSPTFMRMMRFFRIARLLKLIRVNPGIKRLLATVVVSAPSLANVGVLLLLILYIYAILGVEFFSDVAHGEFVNEDANFSSFGFAMLTLFRCITGESYNGIMHDVMVTEAGSAPGRCSDSQGTCGNPAVAIPFFISFVLIGSFVMLNVFVAVILDAFAEDAAAEETEFGPIQIDEFTDVWQRFDGGGVAVPAGTPRGISMTEIETSNVLPTKHLVALLRELKAPMGFKDALHPPTAGEVLQRVKELNVPDRNGFVAFHDLLQAFARHSVGEAPLPPADTDIGRTLREVKESAYVGDVAYERVKPLMVNGEEVSAEKIHAALQMQALFRRRSSVKSVGGKDAAGSVGGARGGGPKGGVRKPSAAGAAAAFGGAGKLGGAGSTRIGQPKRQPNVKPLSTQQAVAGSGRLSPPPDRAGTAQSARPSGSSVRGGGGGGGAGRASGSQGGARRPAASQRELPRAAKEAAKEVHL